jgi:hypothetical protein
MRIPKIPTEYIEVIGFVVLLIVFAIIVAGILEHIQTKSETEALREDAQDIIDMINRRDNYYGK